MKERDLNFFRPLWRRVAVTAVCVVWAALELWHGEQLWIVITLGLTAYAVWSFFIAFDRTPAKAPPAQDDKGDDNVPPPS